MTVLRNILVHWVAPIALFLLVYAGIQAMRAPAVTLSPDGRAPEFSLVDADGARVQLADFRGKRVLVNFWASWCAPCRAEIPALNRFAKKNPEITVLGIGVDSRNEADLKRFGKQLGIEYPVLAGTDQVQRAYGVSTLPTSLLLDEDGKIVRTHVGLITRAQLALWTR